MARYDALSLRLRPVVRKTQPPQHALDFASLAQHPSCTAGKSGRISHFDAQYNQYFVYMPDLPTGTEARSIEAPIPMLVRRALLNPM